MTQKQLRILIVTDAPLAAELGAGQVAVNLAMALEKRGHQVVAWSAWCSQEEAAWWQSLHKMRMKLDALLRTQEPFDVVDVPPELLTRTACKAKLTVCRSVKPPLAYLLFDLNYPGLRLSLRRLCSAILKYPYSLYHALLVVLGWQNTDIILSLGSLELAWMRRWFPCWRTKLCSYSNALSPSDQASLAAVRLRGESKQTRCGLRFLWLGRWHPHKGTDILTKFIEKRARENPHDTFTIAGCGTAAVDQLPKALIEAGRLSVVPGFPRSQLTQILDSHDVGLFTSRAEGWGLVLNEMLEAGLTVYATEAGAVPDLKPFFPHTLRTFPPEDNLTLSEKPWEQEYQYYQVYNWDAIAEEYLELVSSVRGQLSQSAG